jgi:anthranilate phosphoribosyltransferase
MVAGKVQGIRDGVAAAAQVIDSGAAREALAKMQRASAVG